MIELRHLRHFVAVAETCHFGRAAEQVHIAQPALSQSIRQLESQLGAALFVRTTRSVKLTPAGDFLLGEARRALEIVDQSVRGVRQIADGQAGLLRIAFTGTAAFNILPRMARIIRAEHPDIALDIHADLLTPAQVEGLTTRQLDLGVLRPTMHHDGIQTRTITVERLVVALPVEHRLADQPAIAMSDLRTENMVRYADDHSAVNEAVLRSCRSAGFEPLSSHSGPSTSVILGLVSGGLGVALVPESVRTVELSGVVFREVEDAASTTLSLAWSVEGAGAVARQVIATLDREGFFAPVPSRRTTEVSA
jgi:DNA-binding transcriptional LysR family regulator